MTMTPARRLQAHRAYGRSADAFDAVAWRPPTPARFDGRPANDTADRGEAPSEEHGSLRTWATVVGGSVAAAMMGALLGGMLHI